MLGMLRNGGEMGVICPSTLFADVSVSTLRKHLLARNKVSYIKYFSEEDPLFEDVTQATCIFHLSKGEESKSIDIVQRDKNYRIALEDVKQVFPSNWEIPSIEETEWNILRKLQRFPKLKECSGIRNRRGELDLSMDRKYITTMETPYRLVRGNMIRGDKLIDWNHEYVIPEFFDKKSQDYLSLDRGKKRLVCQQISNMSQQIRVHFVECESSDVIGNSCNYIMVAKDRMPKVKALLNSALLNWRFKITSTNNHINNYELDDLPIVDLDSVTPEIVKMDDVSRDKAICSLYGLEQDETDFIISQQYEAI
jgi:adenine-specific DNA-methyltransferase